MGIKVRAIKKGYYNFMLREPGKPGDVFEIKDDEAFSEKWMERVVGSKPAPKSDVGKEPSKGHASKGKATGTRASDESKI